MATSSEIEPLSLGIDLDFAAAEKQLADFQRQVETTLKNAFAAPITMPKVAPVTRAATAAASPRPSSVGGYDPSKVAALGDALERVAMASAGAERKLAVMAATGDKVALLQARFAQTAVEIETLANRSGNAELGAKAFAAAQEKLARDLVAAKVAADSASGSTRGLGVSAAAASTGVTQLGYQLSDVVTQLEGGTNPLTILIQQGPQVVQAMQMGGIGVGFLAKGIGVAVAAAAGLTITLTTLYGVLGPIVDVIGEVAGELTGLEFEPVTEAMEAQQRAAAILSQSYEDLGPILDDTREKQRELAVLTGKMTEDQSNLAQAAEDAFARYQTAIEATRTKLSELKREQSSVSTQVVDMAEDWIPAWTPLGYALRNLTSSSEDYREEIYAGEAAMQTAMVTLGENVDINRKVVVETKKHEEAEKGRSAALKDSKRDLEELTRALAKFAEVQREAEAATRLAVVGMEEVGTTGAAKVYAELNSELEKLSGKQAEIVFGLEEERSAAFAVAHSYEERVAVALAAHDAIAAVDDQYAQERILASEQAEAEITAILAEQEEIRLKAAEDGLKMREDLAKKQAEILKKGAEDSKKMAEAQRDMVNQALQAAQQVAAAIGNVFAQQQAKAEEALAATRSELDKIAGLLEGLSMVTVDAATLSGDALVQAYTSGQVAAEDLSTSQKVYLQQQLQQEQDAAKQREQAQKDAALAAWEAQHATALAMALINIPLAVSQALASAPYPANLVFAGISGALAGAAAIAVAAEKPPSFRAGYMPDQRLAMIEPQSEIVAPASAVQAMGGREAAQKAFAGVAPSGGGTQKTVFMLGHREFSAMSRNSADRPGVFRDLTRKPSTGSRRPYG